MRRYTLTDIQRRVAEYGLDDALLSIDPTAIEDAKLAGLWLSAQLAISKVEDYVGGA